MSETLRTKERVIGVGEGGDSIAERLVARYEEEADARGFRGFH
jgi:hypothetical protein